MGAPNHRRLAGLFAAAVSGMAHAGSVDFAKDVFPILQRSCFECHDQKLQKGKLRLDAKEHAFKRHDIIVKGDAENSELYRRVILPRNDEDVMPSRGEPLSKAQTEIIKAWIDSGADWPDEMVVPEHWAYVAPLPPVVPDTAPQPVDSFIRARLAAEGLRPAPEADRATLLRRLSLDLIGLPPTPAETDAFVNDRDPLAYEKLVDRLLASDQFGVRWARPWLDLARYADSHGFQRDDLRDLWPYRDWVVDALNADMPFTQFTIEQIAGDLLPDATEAQRIATGFNRSAPTNVEAGSDPEETRVNQVHDRVNTVGMTWLGTALECAQCHDHKYDPISQRDYYGMFAFFNNTSLEADRRDAKVPGSIQFIGPEMELDDPVARDQGAKLRAEIARVDAELADLAAEATVGQPEWEAELTRGLAEAAREHVLGITGFESAGGATHEILSDRSVLISGEPAPDQDTYTFEVRTELTGIRGIKLEALTDDSLPGKGPGRGDAKKPNFVLNNFVVTAAPAGAPERARAVEFSRARASFSQARYPVSNLRNSGNAAKAGWAIAPRFHQPHWAVLEPAEPIGFGEGTILRFKLEQNHGAGRTIGRLRVSAVTGSVSGPPVPVAVAEALALPAAERGGRQRQAIADFRLKGDPRFVSLGRRKSRLEAQLRKLRIPTTLVMREDTPRASHVFERGDFRMPGERVEPSVPTALHPLAVASPGDPTRLDLARLLVSRDNPLAARVVVNRWWAELFGRGLVTTPEDFGIKGEPPTHPELLDWLAVEFMDKGWSMKSTLKTIVMSETYRQSSRVTPELLERDDKNLLLARGPRHRLGAEAIRDNALSIAGLLNLKRGGEPVRPYQPPGLWVKLGGQRYEYEVSPGGEKYRRGLYVVWKRSAPYPSFVNFDADARMACRVSRPLSNTPLQALTLMNDPVHVEAAMAFAKRMLAEMPAADDPGRVIHGFRVATGRPPSPAELATLSRLLAAERAARAANPEAAKEFVAGFPLPPGVSAEEFVAWYAIAATLLNLDETISKG
jgi:hypothetical protein